MLNLVVAVLANELIDVVAIHHLFDDHLNDFHAVKDVFYHRLIVEDYIHLVNIDYHAHHEDSKRTNKNIIEISNFLSKLNLCVYAYLENMMI